MMHHAIWQTLQQGEAPVSKVLAVLPALIVKLSRLLLEAPVFSTDLVVTNSMLSHATLASRTAFSRSRNSVNAWQYMLV